MEHNFNVEVAEKLGVIPAVILNNIYFWIKFNEANEKHFHDGCYWTFNSKKSFKELFPYLTERQISYSLQKLIDSGYIKTANYNELKYDRTLWYALTENGYSILQNCQMESTNLSNRLDTIVQPIPDIKPNNKPDINTNKKKLVKTDVVYDKDEKVNQAILDFITFRKEIKSKMTDKAIELMVDKLNKLASSNKDKIDIINQSIERGWKGLFELKNDQTNNKGNPTSPNKFNNFPQRQYTNDDYSSLEQHLLNK